MVRTFFLAAVFSLAHVGSAQPSSYDADVVLALLGLQDASDLEVGSAPAALQPFVPTDGDVLATVARPGAFGSGRTSVYVRLPVSADDARAAYGEPEVDGWTLRPRFEPTPNGEGGFVSDRRDDGPRRLIYDSSEETRVVLEVHFWNRMEGAFAEIVRRHLHPMELDLGNARAHDQRREPIETALPLLYPPPGAMQRRTGGGGGGDRFTLNGLLESDLAPEAVAAHYADQLLEAGWTTGGTALEGDAVVSTWARTADGRPLGAMFYAVRSAPDTYRLRLSIVAAEW